MVEAPIWNHVPRKPPEPGWGSHTSEAWAALRYSKDFQNFYKPLAGTAIHEAVVVHWSSFTVDLVHASWLRAHRNAKGTPGRVQSSALPPPPQVKETRMRCAGPGHISAPRSQLGTV